MNSKRRNRNPLFWVAATLITVFVLMAVWPSLFTSTDPTDAVLAKSRERPNSEAWFGRDIQGYDIYARCIYGARASILVGVMCTLGTVLIGGIILCAIACGSVRTGRLSCPAFAFFRRSLT